jgi:NitT/TauT family transport system substrate-binding protein
MLRFRLTETCRLFAPLFWLICAGFGGDVAAAEPKRELRLGFFPNITHAQALYARATGYFEKKIGAPIRWTSFNAGPTAIETLFADEIDATFIGPSPTINGWVMSHGEKFVVIAGAADGGAALVVRSDSPIKSPGDFANKIIATPQLGNTQDVAARVWFKSHGLVPIAAGGTLNLVALSNPDQLTLFRENQIDGAWTVEPWVSRLEMEAGGRVFLEEKDLWPQGKYVTTHLIVTRDFLHTHPDEIRDLLRAHIEVTRMINSDKAAAIPILNEQIRKDTGRALKQPVIESALKRVVLTWDPAAPSLYRDADEAHQIHFLHKAPELTGIFQLQLLNEVLKEKELPPVSGKESP